MAYNELPEVSQVSPTRVKLGTTIVKQAGRSLPRARGERKKGSAI